MSDILVLVEHRDNEIDPVTLQLLNKGRKLADQMKAGLGAIIIGKGIDAMAKDIAGKGVDSVLTVDAPELADYNPESFTTALADVVKSANPSLLLMGYTFLGMEVGPALSARLGMPLVTNCVDIELSAEGAPIVVRPMYDETVNVKMKGSLPLIVSIQKGVLPGSAVAAREAKVVAVDSKIDLQSLRTELLEVLKPKVGEVDLKKADVIVAVGRGIGQAKNIDLARKLANALGGVIAASRPVIDMGWLPAEYQVGLSGSTVSPRVYIACGISGAAQHVAGMAGTQMIIAINKDPNAPIFGVAHYAVVGDLFQVVPALIEAAGVKN